MVVTCVTVRILGEAVIKWSVKCSHENWSKKVSACTCTCVNANVKENKVIYHVTGQTQLCMYRAKLLLLLVNVTVFIIKG